MSQNIINVVQTNLRSRGYRVRKLPRETLGFDFLVENKYRVFCVKKAKTVPASSEKFDVVAIVSFDAAKRPVIQYSTGAIGGAYMPTINPKVFFGEVKSKRKNESKKIEGKSESKAS